MTRNTVPSTEINGMQEALEFKIPTFRISGEELIDAILFIFPGWFLGQILEPAIHSVNLFPSCIDEGHQARTIDAIPSAEAEQKVVMPKDDTIFLPQPDPHAYLFGIELLQQFNR